MSPSRSLPPHPERNEKRKKTDERAPQREPYAVGEIVARPGQTVTAGLGIARLPTGGELSLPLTIVHGSEPGPTLAVTAAIHGDELNGTLAISRLLSEIDARDLRGTLLTLPIVNPLGLLNHSRYLPDRRDLNRCFPGSKRGSLGSRIAYTLTTGIIERADAVIDLHTGSLGRANLPQLRCNLDDAKARRLARVFGAPAILHAGLRDGSLRAVCGAYDIPAFVFEGGEALRADSWAVAAAHRGLLRVMRHLGMLDTPAEVVNEPEPAERFASKKSRLYAESQWLRAVRSGFCQLEVELGDSVKTGDTLGVIRNPVENTKAPVTSDFSGLVLGRLMTSLVNRGDALIHIATERYVKAGA